MSARGRKPHWSHEDNADQNARLSKPQESTGIPTSARCHAEEEPSELQRIADSVHSKSLIKSGLVFRRKDGKPHHDLNLEEHVEELSQILQTDSQVYELCDGCNSLGLEFFHLLEFPDSFPTGDHRPMTTGAVVSKNHSFRPSCAMCALFISIIPDLCYPSFDIRWILWRERTAGLAVVPGAAASSTWRDRDSGTMTAYHTFFVRTREKGIILPCRNEDEQDPAGPARARLTRPHDVDLNVVSSWMEFCKATHDKCCEKHDQLHSLRMIDCRQKKLVLAPADCAYVCLSYVWGKQANESATAVDLDSDHLPILFKDAMVVTQKLGFDYLWVDRYCIPQDRSREKHHQIRNMDKIYACSEATIIASCSPDATVGLAGISDNRGQQQQWAQVGRNCFTVVNWKYRELIRKSKWNSRGWTYQEALLSRRTIVFTESMVYFQCKSGYFEESLDHTLVSSFSRTYTAMFFSRPPLEDFLGNIQVWRVIAEYRCRQLSYESDILNAILGIMQKYSSDYPGFEQVWGIPLVPWKVAYKRTYSELLAEGLCWFPGKSLTRRGGFPSWSWTGWLWTEMGSNTPIQTSTFTPAIALVDDLSFFTGSGLRISVDDYFATPAEERPDVDHSLGFGAWVTPIQLIVEDGIATIWLLRDGEPIESRVLEQSPAMRSYNHPIYGVIICATSMGRRCRIYALLTEYDGVSFTRIGNLPPIDIGTTQELYQAEGYYQLNGSLEYRQKFFRKISSVYQLEYREIELR